MTTTAIPTAFKKIVSPGILSEGGRLYVTIEYDGWRLSITGVSNHGCGQCSGPWTFAEYSPGWCVGSAARLSEVWNRWHLNDIRAGCEHQRALGWKSYDDHPSEPCPECGYKYGSAWLREEVPADVLAWLQSLPTVPTEPRQSAYDLRADEFLTRFGITYAAEYIGPDCPPFCEPSKHGDARLLPCKGVHGGKYRAKFTRERTGSSLAFNFWNSYADEYGPGDAQWLLVNKVPRFGTLIGERWTVNTPLVDRRCMPSQRGTSGSRREPVVRNKVIAKPPTAYGVLASVALDADCPPTFEEWAREYGYDPDSRRARASYTACASHALALRQFFTSEELAELSNIR